MTTLADIRAEYPELDGLDDGQAIDVIQQEFYPELPRETIAKRLGYEPPKPPAEPSSGMRRFVGDTGVSLLRGAIAVPEAVVGAADLVTGGRAGRMAEQAGFRPKEAKAFLADYYSPEQKAAFQEVQQAEGIVDTAGAVVRNPSVIAQTVAESLPSMGAGGVVARGARMLAPGMSPLVAGAAGEGAVSAGLGAEQIRQETADGLLSGEQSAIAAGSGAATGLLGLFGAKVAKSLGIADVDTMLAGAAKSDTARKSVVRKAVEGFVAEGLLEELPQSVQEQVAQNAALGKPLDEGVDQAAVLGVLSGGLMGAGAQLLPDRGPLSRAANAGIQSGAIPTGMPGVEPIMQPAVEAVADTPDATPPGGVIPGAIDPDAALARMEASVQREQQDERGRAFAQERGARPAPVAEAVDPLFVPEDDLGEPQPTDVLNPKGSPFKNRLSAQRALKQHPGTALAVVKGGWVLRPIAGESDGSDLAVPSDVAAAAGDGSGGDVAGSSGSVGQLPAGDGRLPAASGAPERRGESVEPVGAAGEPDPTLSNGAPVAGEAIDEDWTAFAPESGTKGVPRADMPQIKAEHRGAMTQFLKGRGIAHEQEREVDPASLKPTQAEFSRSKVLKAREFSDTDRAILVSQDGHVLDGHHQWIAAMAERLPIRVIRLDAPIDTLIEAVREFPSATASEGATPPTETAPFSLDPDVAKALQGLGMRSAAAYKDRHWFMPMEEGLGLGDVSVDFDADGVATVTAEYFGKTMDTRKAKGAAAIAAAVERARDGIQAGLRRMAAEQIAKERGVEAPAAPAALPAPDASGEDAPEARWTRSTAADRQGVLARAGWSFTPKPSLAAQRMLVVPWAKMTDSQRSRISAALAEQDGSATTPKADDTNQPSAAAAKAETAAVEAPAPTAVDAGAAGADPAARPAHAQAAGMKPKAANRKDLAALRERGQQPASAMDAERRFSAGERIFVGHDMDEQAPMEVFSVFDMQAYTHDQMLALPAKAAAAPTPRKAPKKVAEANAAREAKRADYFAPGNVLKGYGGLDRVLEYRPQGQGTRNGAWEVQVQRVIKRGDDYVPAPNETPRWHSTEPDERALAAGPVKKGAPEVAEPAKASSNHIEKTSANTIFTEDAAAAARALLKRKLGQVSSGIDPEILQAGITLAGYHIEQGARSFAAYAKAMVDDLGDAIRPYLKSFYMAVKYDPRAAGWEGMDSAAAVEAADVDRRTETGPPVEAAASSADTAKQEPPNDPAPPTDAPAVDSTLDAGLPDLLGDQPARGARSPRAGDGRADGGSVRGTRGRSQAADDGQRNLGDEPGLDAVPARPAGTVESGGGRVSAGDYRPEPGSLTREGSWFATAARNIDLIELAIRIEGQNRPATPEEQAQLSKYVGFGASEIRNALFPVPPAYLKAQQPNRLIWPDQVREARWKPLAERMDALPVEWQRSILQSSQYAHYTSEGIIRSVWGGLQRLGFTGGKVLEPGMGIGSFAMLMPDSVRATSKYTGVEFDGPTALIARLLSPQQNMLHEDFIKRKFPRDYFDVAVGNPPFSQTKILGDPDYEKFGFMLHDFFFAKSLDRVRPGGLLVFVTSKGTMDKQTDKARRYMAERADLLGAIRLPSTAFEANAGTSVVTDVIFLRKRLPGEAPGGQAWQSVKTIDTQDGEAVVNEYFAEHPEMVLGQQRISGNTDDQGRRINSNGMGGEKYTVVSYDKTPAELDAKFAAAIEKLPANAYSVLSQTSAQVRKETAKVDFDPSVKREGVVYLGKDGALMRVEQGVGRPLDAALKLSAKDAAWFKGYVGIREMVQLARAAQVTDGDWQASLKQLNKAYDAFRKEHGPINDFRVQVRKSTDEDGSPVETEIRIFKNRRLFREDYDAAVVTQLETINEAGEIIKSPFLLGRTIGKPVTREVKSVGDALAVSLDEFGRLDLDDVARRISVTRDEAIEALGNQVFKAPQGDWQLADEYLSGDVVAKLEEAELAARIDASLARNVEALKAVQPEKLGPSQISVKAGASWVPVAHVNAFAKEIGAGSVTFDPKTESWQVSGGNLRSERKAGAEYGTADRSPSELLEAVLNSQTITIKRTTPEKKTETDTNATTAANEAARKIKDKFKGWIWTDTDRASELVEIYNKRFNNIAPRRFDGSHMTLPGVSLRFNLHPHQKRAIWRQVQTGNTYLAHAVGAGKTIEMIAGGMEQKRLGLIRKPVYAVPNHMLEQFANEFMELYPLANIMVADDENFSAERRKAFVAAATLNAPDAIVITHSAFERVGVKEETVAPIRDEILLDLQMELDEAKGDRVRRSQLEQQIEAVTQRFDSIAGVGKKDSTIKFEDMGADFVYVDEAHAFRKLDFTTNQKIKGIDPNGSRRALDMYVKTRWLEKERPGRSMVFASGTPVTNTMGELYTIMRYFSPDELTRAGISTFDAWARQFGEAVPALEANAAGRYEVVERFAKFDNVPELMSRVRQFMDVLTSEHLGALVKRPDIEGGKPDLITVEPTAALKSYMRTELLPRLEKSRRWKPSKDEPFNPDPVIAITSDGRFAALDPRFFGETIDEDATPTKLTRMADETARIYKESADNEYLGKDGKPEPIKGSTQIVFYNLGFGVQSQKNRGFDARAALTRRMVAQGVKRDHILWFDDANTDAKKEAMFKAMRSGQARVLIGSAKKMGTGVNVQKRLLALHYFDPPWYPSDVEQPHGRIIRQGNQNDVATIKWYATKGTYDSTMWQMVGRKQRFIDQAFSGDKSLRSMEDMSEASMFEQAAAVASGDPRALQLAGLRQDVERMERLQAAHASEQINVRSALRSAEWGIETYTDRVKKYEAAFKAVGGKYFAFERGTVGDRTLDKLTDFGQAVKDAFNRGAADAVVNPGTVTRPIGSLSGGVEIRMEADADREGKPNGMHELVVKAGGLDIMIANGPAMDAQVDALGLARRIVNAVNGIESDLGRARADLVRNETDATRLRKKLGAPFEYQQELAEKYGDLKRLEEELRAEGEAEAKAAAAPPIVVKEDGSDGSGEALSIADNPTELRRVADNFAKAFGSPLDPRDRAADTGAYGPATQAHRDLAATLQRRLQGRFPGTVFDAVAPGGGPQGRGLAAVTTVAKRLYGHDVVAVDFGATPPLFNGAMSDAIPGVVFVRADSSVPHMAVLGHELLHQLAGQQPGIYRTLVNRLDKLMVGQNRYVERQRARYASQGNDASNVDFMEELRADIVGDFFTDGQFWKDMAQDQPGLFRRVANAIIRFLDDAAAFITKERPFGTEKYLTDIAAARAAVVDAMRQFSGAQVGAMTTQSDGINLSIADTFSTLATKKGLSEAYNDLTRTQAGFNWWHKSIGTQYAKAKRNADFGRVYERAQDYLHDTSAFSNDAAGQAATLLPQLKGWKDVLRPIALKDADRAAVSKAVFEGTLTYARNADGELVEAGSEDAAGVVFTDAELSALGMNEKQRGLYREFRAATDRSLDILVAADVARLLGKGLPDPIKQMVSDGDTGRFKGLVKAFLAQKAGETATAVADMKKRQAKERAELTRAQTKEDKTTKTASTIARDARHEEARAALQSRHDGELAGAVAERDMWAGLQDRVADKYMRIDELKERGYAPLMRFGKFSVYVTREGADGEEREQVYFGLYETEREANKAAREFADSYKDEPGVTVQQGLLSEQGYKLFSGMSPETMAVFADLAGMERNEQFEAYLKLALANRSALKRLIKRKGVAGFSDDVNRVLASFVTSNARAASSSLHLGAIAESIGDMQKRRVSGDVIDEAIKLKDYVQNPVEEAQAIRGLLFVQYLGGSVASAMVNMTQPLTMTFPFLSQFGGPAKAGVRLAAAMKQAVGKVSSSTELGRALDKAEKEGIVSPQEIHQLQAEASRNVGNRPWVRKTLFLWGSMFSLAEQFNRRASFIAAWNTAVEEGMADPFAFAADAVDQTQGVYNRGNKPNWARGALGGTLFTFKQFSISYLEFLGRLPPREKALALAVLLLAAGAQGLPGADDLDDLIDTLAQQSGYDFNSKQAKARFLTSVLGRGGADFLLRGFSAIPGFPLDVSARLSVGNLLPGTGLLLKSETDKGRGMQEILGPAGSFGADLLKVAENRDPLLAVPLAIRNLAKGLEMMQTGEYRDTRGRKVTDVDAGEAVTKMVGFQPAEVARLSRDMGEKRQQVALARVIEAEIAGEWAAGLVEKKPEKVRAARERLKQWNADNPNSRIAISDAQIARRAREMRITRDERFMKTVPKEMRGTLQ